MIPLITICLIAALYFVWMPKSRVKFEKAIESGGDSTVESEEIIAKLGFSSREDFSSHYEELTQNEKDKINDRIVEIVTGVSPDVIKVYERHHQQSRRFLVLFGLLATTAIICFVVLAIQFSKQ